MFVPFFDPDVVISIFDIKFGEYLGATKVCEEISD
jgi:hypothetical protein